MPVEEGGRTRKRRGSKTRRGGWAKGGRRGGRGSKTRRRRGGWADGGRR